MTTSRRRGRPKSVKRAVRGSFSMSPETYRTLEALARQKKVSTAWILREATDRYIAEQWPLLGKGS